MRQTRRTVRTTQWPFGHRHASSLAANHAPGHTYVLSASVREHKREVAVRSAEAFLSSNNHSIYQGLLLGNRDHQKHQIHIAEADIELDSASQGSSISSKTTTTRTNNTTTASTNNKPSMPRTRSRSPITTAVDTKWASASMKRTESQSSEASDKDSLKATSPSKATFSNKPTTKRHSSGTFTDCGRHSNEWLFNGFSIKEAAKGLLKRRDS